MSTLQGLRIEQLAQRPDVLPVVARWIYDEWWTEVDGETAQSVAAMMQANVTLDRLPLTLVASLGHGPVGTVTLIDHDVGTEQWQHLTPWMAALYVVPAFRRIGIGTTLVNAVSHEAAQLGMEILHLLTIGRDNFYAGIGWEAADKLDGQVVMSKRTSTQTHFAAG